MRKPLTQAEVIERFTKVHGNEYDYSKSIYIDCFTSIIITCKKHGDISVQPRHHWRGAKCKRCSCETSGNLTRKTTEQFIVEANKIHGDKYTYEYADYKNKSSKVEIVCKNHGIFTQRADSHLEGYGCCKCKETFGEREIRKFLQEHKIVFHTQFSFKECKKTHSLLFDFYLPNNNLCIEYNGKQHYEHNHFFVSKKGFSELQERDNIKKNYCFNNNINLLVIKYDENIIEKLSSELFIL